MVCFLHTIHTSFVLLVVLVGCCAAAPAYIKYEWNYLNFTFPTAADTDAYFTNKHYESCMLAGIKIDLNGNVYVSVPRWNPNVPATLSKLVPSDNPKAPLLSPFPSWEMNAVGDSAALQSVLGFEIDDRNWLWILDQGKVNNQAAIAKSIKLVVWDLNTNKLVRRYVFPAAQAGASTSFLNDLVLDRRHGDNTWAYITDSGILLPGMTGPNAGGILVYDFNKNESRRVLNETLSTQPQAGYWVTINGEKILHNKPMLTGADGIALTPDATLLYYCPLTGDTMYTIETRYLRDWSQSQAAINNAAKNAGKKTSASDGLAADNMGRIYATLIERNGVGIFNGADDVSIIAQDLNHFVWPDTIGFDHHGNMLVVSNNLGRFVQGELSLQPFNMSAPSNFHIWSLDVGAGSYLDSLPGAGGNNGSKVSPAVVVVIVIVVLLVGAVLMYMFFRSTPALKRNRSELDDSQYELMRE